jgi:hypothetical protein
MQPKFAAFASAFLLVAGLAITPVLAQTAPAAPVAKPAEVKPATTPPQTAEAACVVHKKDSKEFKDCVEKSKAAAAPKATPKDPAKKS